MLNHTFDLFVETLDGQSKNNIKNYRQRLKTFLEKNGEKEPGTITAADINIWYRNLDDGSRKPTTLSGYRQAIKALFNWLHDNQKIKINPTKHLKTSQFISTETQVPDEADVALVTAVAELWKNSDKAKERRAACLWFWSLESGGRLGGFLYLRKKEFERGAKRPDSNGVYEFKTISKGKENTLEVTKRTVQATNQWLEVRPQSKTQELLTSLRNPYNAIITETGCGDYQLLSSAAGLDCTITSHMMRHRMGTLITEMFDPKLAAMKLNHADYETAATAITFYYRPNRSAISSVTAQLSQRQEK